MEEKQEEPTELALVPVHDQVLTRKGLPWKPELENTLHNRLLQWRDDCWGELAPSTYRRQQFYVDAFEIYMAGKQLTSETVAGYTNYLLNERRLKNSTIALRLTTIKAFLNWCYLHEYISRDLAKFIKRVPKEIRPVPQTFTYDQYVQLRDSARGTEYYWAFILAYHTGLHWVDVCYFRWSSVDLDNMMIRCIRIKLKRFGAKSTCWIPIITNSDLHLELVKMKEALKTEVRREEDEDFICPVLARQYTGSYTSPQAWRLEKRIKNVFPGKTFKTFRATFASNVANSGMNLVVATKLTGHTDPKSLMVYVKPDEAALRDGLEKAFEYGKNKHDQTGISIPGHVIAHGGTAPVREDEHHEEEANVQGSETKQKQHPGQD